MPLHASDTGELFKNKKFQTNSALFLFLMRKIFLDQNLRNLKIRWLNNGNLKAHLIQIKSIFYEPEEINECEYLKLQYYLLFVTILFRKIKFFHIQKFFFKVCLNINSCKFFYSF